MAGSWRRSHMCGICGSFGHRRTNCPDKESEMIHIDTFYRLTVLTDDDEYRNDYAMATDAWAAFLQWVKSQPLKAFVDEYNGPNEINRLWTFEGH